MTEYFIPTGLPSGYTFGAVLSREYDERIAPIAHLFEHQFTAMEPRHRRKRCPDCRHLGELKPRPEEHVFCAICRCCGLLAEEDPEGVDFCAGGCAPPSTPHAPIAIDEDAPCDQPRA